MSELKKINSINEFIETKLASQIGEGKRYHNQAHFEQVRADIIDLFYPDGIDDHKNLYDDYFIDPDQHGLTYRQSIILASLLGLTKNEFSAFSKLIENKSKLLPADDAPPGSPDYMGFAEAERLPLRRDEVIKLINEKYIPYYRLSAHNGLSDYSPQTTPVDETHTLDKIDITLDNPLAIPVKAVEQTSQAKPKTPIKNAKAQLSSKQLEAAAEQAVKIVDIDALIAEGEQISDDEIPDADTPQKPAPIKAVNSPPPKPATKAVAMVTPSSPPPKAVTATPKIIAPITAPQPSVPAVISQSAKIEVVSERATANRPIVAQSIPEIRSNHEVKAIIEKATTLQQAISAILELQKGAGKRFESRDHINLVLEAAAEKYGLDPNILKNPDSCKSPITIGPSQILGAIMRLGNEDSFAFRKLIEKINERRFPHDRSNHYQGRIDPGDLTKYIEQLIKDKTPSLLALTAAYQKLEAEAIQAEEQGLLHEYRNQRENARIIKEEIGFKEDLENLRLTIQEEKADDERVLEQQKRNEKERDNAQKARDREIRKANAAQRKSDLEEAKKRRTEKREARAAEAAAALSASYAGYRGGEKTKQDLNRKAAAEKLAQQERKEIIEERTSFTTRIIEERTSGERGSRWKSAALAAAMAMPDDVRIPLDESGQMIRGKALLDYANQHQLTFGQLISRMNLQSGLVEEEFAKTLGLDQFQLSKLKRDAQRRYLIEDMHQLIDRLSFGDKKDPDKKPSDDEYIAWRQLMLKHLHPDTHHYPSSQENLNRWIDQISDDASKQSMANNHELRTQRISELYNIAMQTRGVPSLIQLADETSRQANDSSETAKKLRTKLANIATAKTGTKFLDGRQATMFASYLFPDDKKRQSEVIDLFTHERYSTPDEERTRRIWASRRAGSNEVGA